MKAAFQDNIYEFHYNRNGNKFWRCGFYWAGCPARIISKNNLMFPYCLNHNHEIEPVTLIPTGQFVANTASTNEVKVQAEKLDVVKIATATDLKARIKERMAAISKLKKK